MAQGAAAARRLTIIVVAALGVAGLAACGKDEAPPVPTSLSLSSPAPTSPSPTPSPTPTARTPPPKPAEWTQNDDAGALAAAQYFMDLYNYAIATGDLAEWSALATSDCQFCANVTESASSAFGDGGRLEGGQVSPEDPAVVGRDETFAITTVELHVTISELRELERDGSVSSTTPRQEGWVILDLYFEPSDGWRFFGADSRDESVR